MSRWLAIGVGVGVAVATLLFARRIARDVPPMPECVEKLAYHHGGIRPLTALRLIVLHSTEGSTAAGAAGWFQNPASGGSAHIVVDDTDCYRTLPDDVIPWGAMGGDANAAGLHLEQAGYAAWSRSQWLAHRETLRKAAGVVRTWGEAYGIPMRFLDAAAVKRGERGITTHAEVTRAYGIAGGHTDPGTGYPLDVLLGLVGAEENVA